jgi:hypothetical protein
MSVLTDNVLLLDKVVNRSSTQNYRSLRGRRGRDRIVVEFTTICATSVCQH